MLELRDLVGERSEDLTGLLQSERVDAVGELTEAARHRGAALLKLQPHIIGARHRYVSLARPKEPD